MAVNPADHRRLAAPTRADRRSPAAPTRVARRVAWGLLAAFLVAFAGLEVANHGPAALAAAIVGLVAPDLPLAIGARSHQDLQRGQLAPRAVPAYNLLHAAWLPLGVLVLYTVTPITWVPLFAAMLGWLLHISLDRTAGYRLRTAAGFQRER